MTNLVSRQFGSVLIPAFSNFWVALLIITLFTIPQTASGVDYKKAEFHPVVNSKGVGVIDPSDEIVNKLYLGESLRLLPIKNETSRMIASSPTWRRWISICKSGRAFISCS